MSPKEIFEQLKSELKEGVLSLDGSGEDGTLLLRQSAIRPALVWLKSQGFNMLIDLTCADFSRFPANFLESAPLATCRFKLTYRLMRLEAKQGLASGRIALQCWVEDAKGPLSIRDLWPCADWLEREVWDMFGVPFADRPDIKRLLLYEEFVGHPLCKDYPINKRQPLIGPKDNAPRDPMLTGDLRPKLL